MIKGSSKPKLKPWVAKYIAEDRIIFSFNNNVVEFDDMETIKIVGNIIPCLTGDKDVISIQGLLPVGVRDYLYDVLNLLESNKLLIVCEEDVADSQAYFDFSMLRDTNSYVAMNRKKQSVAIRIFGSSDFFASLLDIFSKTGFENVDKIDYLDDLEEDCAVLIYETSFYDLKIARRINELVINKRVVSFPVFRYDGEYIRIGPLIIPQITSCLECFLKRRWSNLILPREGERISGYTWLYEEIADNAINCFRNGLIVSVVRDWIIYNNQEIPGKQFLIGINPYLSLSEQLILRLPRCRQCSKASSSYQQLWNSLDEGM